MGMGSMELLHPARPLAAWFMVSLQHFHPVMGFKTNSLGFMQLQLEGFACRALQRSHPTHCPQALNSPRLALPHILAPFATAEVPKWVVDGFSMAGFPPGGRGTGDAAGRGCIHIPGSGVTTTSIPAATGCIGTHQPPSSNGPCLTPQVFQRSSASPFLPKLRYDAAISPGHADLWPNGASFEGWKVTAGDPSSC